MEENNKMAKKKEKLQDEVVNSTPEDVKDKPTEEVVTETETPTTPEPKKDGEVEESGDVDEISEVEELDVDPEQLSREILKTKEELSVIEEVRGELVKLYADYKESEKLKDVSLAENVQLKEQLTSLSASLQEYKIAEEKLAAEKRLQRLEKLSAKFTALGQSKTVEQLGFKDEDTLQEFERIVDAALSKVGETAEMPSVTTNSQTESLSTASDKQEKLSNEVAAEKPKATTNEKLSDKNFFANICNQLTDEQVSVASGKRVKTL